MTPRPVRRVELGVVAGAAAVSAAGLAATRHAGAAGLVGVALLVAIGLLLDVDLPWGGEVPLGHALVIAVAVLTRPPDALAVVGVGLLVVLGARRDAVEVAKVGASAAASVAAVAALRAVIPAALTPDSRTLLEVVLAGVAFLAVDRATHRRSLRQVLPLYVTLVCAAALLAVGYRKNPALGLVAAVPLLVTRYSFERFTSARRAYEQTTEALSLLPEVAGLTPLGHGARTAVYAAALGAELGFGEATLTRITTAARLHHIGYISLHEPEERDGAPDFAELARLSGDLLRETGFLADVADFVEQAQPDRAPVRQLEAAVVRVCSTLDDLAGGEPSPFAGVVDADPFAEVLRRHGSGLERTAAIALLRLHDRHPSIVTEAQAASHTLDLVAAGAAAGHDHDLSDGSESHDCR